MEKQDITTIDDIKLLVNTFYSRVRNNSLIGPIFDEKIADRWPVHLEKMYRFWQTILLDEHTYYGAPFPPHAELPVEATHFDTWLTLFHATIDELFEGEKAAEAKWRADKMALMFQHKIAYYRQHHGRPLM